ncbi:hypothetical protein [Kitasatospora sp. MAP5-34]|uniref:hypothetical protein n=1 Tax=Kitasatospora sp. MAP5-34 TaxID=3035102 RepID=UPI0024731177|nr:hypothetical protein [Kitasatospora sp. MAP5-34]MDH6577383.1 putative ABC transport system permease protein [Kitasatospora sp. MAP5-34]
MTTPAEQSVEQRGGAPLRPAPWVRTRLRAAPLAALLTAALAFGTVFLAAALPRALDRGADQALRQYLSRKGPASTSLLATSRPQPGQDTAAGLAYVLTKLRTGIDGPWRLAPSGPVYGSRGLRPRTLTTPGLHILDVEDQLGLLYVADLAAHAKLVAGQWPTGVAPDRSADTGGDPPIPIALAKSAADTIGVRLGSVLDGTAGSPGFPLAGPMRVEVVGLYTADDPADVFWTGLACPTEACLEHNEDHPPRYYWQVTGVTGPEVLSNVGSWGQGMEDFWRLPVDTGRLHSDQLSTTRAKIASFTSGPTAARLAVATSRPDLSISSDLPGLFDQALARQAAAAPLGAIGPAGVAGVAAVVLCLAAALAGDRRAEELRLLLARGGSRTGILRRLIGESAVCVLPGVALGTLLALLLLPTPRWSAAVLAALATGLLALLAFPVRAAVLLSAPRVAGAKRRLVAELALLAVTVAAVAEVRRRGVAPAGDGLDPLLVAAPLLLALAGALLLARLQPLLVGVLARAAGRGPGLIGFLGLARAARGTGRQPRPSVLPMLAMMLAVTTAGFGSTVLDAVDTSRAQAARESVGGDAVVIAPSGSSLPDGFAKAAAALPGVRSSTTIWTDSGVNLIGSNNTNMQVTLIVADPVAYAAVARALGRGQFDPALLAGTGGPDAPIPSLVSPDLAGGLTSGTYTLSLPYGELRATVTHVVDSSPALPGSGTATVVVPSGPATAQLPSLGHPNWWLALGPVDDAQLRALVRTSTTHAGAGGASTADNYLAHTSAAAAKALSDDPLQRSPERIFWATVAGAAGFALLAVLLTLVRAAPERAALLARLRTMGLRSRQGLALILAETLPQALAAVAGGGLVAVAAVALLGPAIDLSTLVGAPVPTGLRPAALPVLIQASVLAALVSAGVLGEAAVSGKRQITTELRAGDSS